MRSDKINCVIHNISFAWAKSPTLKNVSLRVAAGEMVAIIGPNGAGKSTLLRLISGFLRPAKGSIAIEPLGNLKTLKRRTVARNIALVPQYSSIFLPYSVQELVTMGRYPYRGILGRGGVDEDKAISSALEVCGVAEFVNRRVTTLSGGEFQRVIIAKALAQEPNMLLLDEPTAHLDLAAKMSIFQIIKKLNKSNGTTIVSVMHDINLAIAYFDRIVILREGSVSADGKTDEVITAKYIEEAYDWQVEILTHNGRKIIVPECKTEVL